MKKKMYRAAWGFLATVLMAFTLLPNIFADHAGLIEQAPQYFTPEYQEFLKSAEEETTASDGLKSFKCTPLSAREWPFLRTSQCTDGHFLFDWYQNRTRNFKK